jgi:hypothetical protein
MSNSRVVCPICGGDFDLDAIYFRRCIERLEKHLIELTDRVKQLEARLNAAPNGVRFS